ncbi:AB hydrolase-1 domain-containing protein [Mycena indigotica]|uniref:AB hydrolase-1 domain-containing protein n=1 Tax=Mycena indigotica TaxID=2126181 RepID=A0A8H6W0Y8_9AGAR|nr:AB hydrolase-1 domain-containing protein [Mycena indigotica]KAF7301484.1 AB hydrolase-1 domain-containing protein [Mycena indigotica]
MAAVANPTLPQAREIPTTFSASLRSWWATNDKTSSVAESRLFQSILQPPQPNPTYVASSSLVTLDKPKQYLNTLAIHSTNPQPDAPSPVVMLPGYGAGIGFYLKNIPVVAEWAGHRGSSLYAVDWLGMGRSARVPFRIRSDRKDIAGRVTEAESFFIDSLESWRAKQRIEKMTLVGHSLGGYLSLAYALRYPDRVNKLILLSPAGIPRDPDETSAPERELESAPHGSNSSVELSNEAKVQEIHAEQAAHKPRYSRGMRLFRYLWDEGWSPFQVVRNTYFWAPMLVGKYSSRRFTGLTDEETRAMHDYILHITLAKGSGEYSISHLLAPGAHARRPMVDRVSALKMPITFVYGDHDWMDPEGGEKSVENLRKAGNGNARSYIVSDAGHHVYLDNPKAVNSLLLKELNRRP